MPVARGVQVQITTKLRLWWTWLRIAARHVGTAKRAREGEVVPHSFEAASSATLSLEFESALVAMTTVSFAMEAIDLELKAAGHQLNKSLFMTPTGATRGFYIAQRLVQAFDLNATQAARLTEELDNLFRLRNESLHFTSVDRVGTGPHPSGTFTAAELTVYTLEAAQDALRIGVDVLDACAVAVPDHHRYHASAVSIAAEIPGVMRMLHEVIAGEGIEMPSL